MSHDLHEGTDTMEEHGAKLDQQNSAEEDDQRQTDGFQFQKRFRNDHLLEMDQ